MHKYEEMGDRVESSYHKWTNLLQEYNVIDDRILGPKEEIKEELRKASPLRKKLSESRMQVSAKSNQKKSNGECPI